MNEKLGQIDLSQIREALSGAGQSAMSGLRSAGTSAAAGLGSAGNSIASWWQNLPDDVKRTALRTAVGTGGGALLAHTAAGGFGDREYRPGLSPALLGALLGGGAAFAAPYGMKMLSGDMRFGKTPGKSIVDRTNDTAIGAVAKHPGLLAGTGGAAAIWRKMAPTAQGAHRAIDRIKDTAQKTDLRNLFNQPAPDYTRIFQETGQIAKGQTANPVMIPPRLKTGLRWTSKPFGPRPLTIPVPRRLVGKNLFGLKAAPRPAMVAGMVAAPLIGAMIDRYAFGRHD